jgi:hypothetical protein
MWQEVPAPLVVKDYAVKSIAIGNKNFIWALATNQTNSMLFKWNADKKSWDEISKNISNIEAIAASSNNILFAFQKKDDAAILQAWNGEKWQEMYRIKHARIGSLAAIDEKKIYAIVNEKAYELSGETWRQLGSLEGFREIAASNDGTVFARRFNFQSALNPETAFPSYSLELLTWNNSEWQKQDVTLAEKTTGIMSIAVQNKETIWCIIREDAAGGKAYKWLPTEKRLDLQGTRTDLYTIAASNDATIWAISWAPEAADRKVYTWAEVKEEPKKEEVKTQLSPPEQPQTTKATQQPPLPLTPQQPTQITPPTPSQSPAAPTQPPAPPAALPEQVTPIAPPPAQVTIPPQEPSVQGQSPSKDQAPPMPPT